MIRPLLLLVGLSCSGAALAAKPAQDLHFTQSWRVSLDASGAVTHLEPTDTLEPAVAAPLERAIGGWRFAPGRVDGVAAPTETMLTLDVRFVAVDGDATRSASTMRAPAGASIRKAVGGISRASRTRHSSAVCSR